MCFHPGHKTARGLGWQFRTNGVLCRDSSGILIWKIFGWHKRNPDFGACSDLAPERRGSLKQVEKLGKGGQFVPENPLRCQSTFSYPPVAENRLNASNAMLALELLGTSRKWLWLFNLHFAICHYPICNKNARAKCAQMPTQGSQFPQPSFFYSVSQGHSLEAVCTESGKVICSMIQRSISTSI